MLEIENVRIEYRNFSLTLSARITQRVTGIFGPSGSGKTTLLEVLSGIRHPREGVIRFNGDLLTEAASRFFVPPEKRRIGCAAGYCIISASQRSGKHLLRKFEKGIIFGASVVSAP
jgi:ABC-type molybdate transport system ATPase subunit